MDAKALVKILTNLPLPILAIAIIPLLLVMSTLFQFIILIAAVAAYTVYPPKAISNPNRSLPYGEQRDGEDIPRRHARIRALLHSVKGATTVPGMMRKAFEEHAKKPCLGLRPLLRQKKEKRTVIVKGVPQEKELILAVHDEYKFKTYAEIGEEIEQFASGLINSGLKSKDKVALFANTRSEWMIAAQAALSQNICVATVYASLGDAALKHSFAETEVSCVITEAELVPKVIQAARDVKSVRTIIYFDKLTDAQLAQAGEHDLRLLSYSEVVAWGSEKQTCAEPPTPEDLAIIMYTSGTTAVPKGVMVTHGNFVSLVAAVNSVFENELKPYLTPEQSFIAYLPLAHILELAAETLCLTRGYCIGYSSTRTLTDDTTYNANDQPCGDIKALRPSIMAAVPIVLDKLRTGIQAKVKKSGIILETLFKIAYFMKRKDYLEGRKSPFWDAILFKKIQANFGGNLQFLLSGGAPLSADTQAFMNIVLGVPVLQGYGLTETCAGSTLCHPDDRTFGRVGGPLPCCELKLVDVPEMKYTSQDTDNEGVPHPRGEVCIRGPSVAKGYFKNTELTKESFVEDKDGQGPWFHTGDIGMWHPDGTLQIIDRKKDLVKLKHGEYLALGHLESVFRESRYVANICVHALSSRGAAVALIVPNEDHVIAFAKAQGINSTDTAVLYNNPVVIAEVKKSLDQVGNKAKLQKYEQLGDFILTTRVWTPENGCLTEAQKLRRRDVYEQHKDDLEVLYKRLKDD